MNSIPTLILGGMCGVPIFILWLLLTDKHFRAVFSSVLILLMACWGLGALVKVIFL